MFFSTLNDTPLYPPTFCPYQLDRYVASVDDLFVHAVLWCAFCTDTIPIKPGHKPKKTTARGLAFFLGLTMQSLAPWNNSSIWGKQTHRNVVYILVWKFLCLECDVSIEQYGTLAKELLAHSTRKHNDFCQHFSIFKEFPLHHSMNFMATSWVAWLCSGLKRGRMPEH